MTTEKPAPPGVDHFSLTLDEAMLYGKISLATLAGCLRAGYVNALLYEGQFNFAPTDMQYLISLFSIANTSPTARDARRLREVLDELAAYLKEKPPTPSVERALENELPLLARSRSGAGYAHIKVAWFCRWAQNKHYGTTVPAMLEPLVMRVFKSIGATQQRGLRSMEDGKQHWGSWWRLPSTVWAMSPDETELVRTVLTGAREPEEGLQMRRGEPWLRGEIAPADGGS